MLVVWQPEGANGNVIGDEIAAHGGDGGLLDAGVIGEIGLVASDDNKSYIGGDGGGLDLAYVAGLADGVWKEDEVFASGENIKKATIFKNS
ncbi:hypothetical protein F0562_023097 [Nyssa sinensis]|uniref:Uncharacterized protein n=1 Tax=Nyssa sinensis TaxID=561372 RepID=A0A5J5BFP7_9ASTE|nr:hypothetical protein F0562_023097 [Nyssa sinensis]